MHRTEKPTAAARITNFYETDNQQVAVPVAAPMTDTNFRVPNGMRASPSTAVYVETSNSQPYRRSHIASKWTVPTPDTGHYPSNGLPTTPIFAIPASSASCRPSESSHTTRPVAEAMRQFLTPTNHQQAAAPIPVLERRLNF
ncbi:hypothetical protein QAD02_002664 [Eretmocerus hayati]|uniref:Uncharacterized protein n=1 Tax=Eretmocerus hayati TaxID=131215 RepID=A0ACC2NJM8_9HYME|nr:hypothetical protein QAD02_002664 [Eretmocerus hayati]